MKLIIDISEEIYQEAIKSGYSYMYDEEVANAVADGIPLDDVKAEIKKMPTDYCGGYIGLDKNEVMEILDNIGRK